MASFNLYVCFKIFVISCYFRFCSHFGTIPTLCKTVYSFLFLNANQMWPKAKIEFQGDSFVVVYDI